MFLILYTGKLISSFPKDQKKNEKNGESTYSSGMNIVYTSDSDILIGQFSPQADICCFLVMIRLQLILIFFLKSLCNC